MEPDGILAGAKMLAISLTAEAARRLSSFLSQLNERAVPAGFVAESDAQRLWERHVLDSLRAAPAFGADDRLAYDLGSGAGLPGLPLAIALPACRFVLCDSQAKRVAFLELVIEQLGLTNAEARHGRVEELDPGADVITARAFAPLPRTWELALPLLVPGGRLVYFAGAGLDDPAGAAARASGGEAEVSLLRSLASAPPLVIMTRK